MATNTTFRYLVLTVLLFSGLFVLGAQSSSYFMHMENDEPRFFQRLSWSGGENASRYELLLEKEDDEANYIIYERRITTELSQYFTLSAGNYRFRIIPYDVLDRQGAGTDWVYFVVYSALRPEIYDVSFDLDNREDERIIMVEVSGKNLLPGAGVYLRNSSGKDILPFEVVYYDGDKILFFLYREQLRQGSHELFVENPGGFGTSKDGVVFFNSIKDRQWDDYLVSSVLANYSISWMPSFPLYGEIGEEATLLGIILHASLTLHNPTPVRIGFEFMASFTAPSSGFSRDDFSVALGGNLLVQKWMTNKKFILNYRLGAGFFVERKNGDGLYLNMGTSLIWMFLQNIDIEAAIDYVHLFGDISHGYLRPWIGVGLTF